MEIPGYKIEKELGVGGMSTVYLATQISFGRKVALKVMSPTLATNKEVATRFVREAQIVAGLSHPHIIPVYDVGSQGACHYMTMDYLTGGDLAQWINRGLEIEEVLLITEKIASALQYAHGKGYIHRDIKPNNILFREDDSPVLTDFGISRLLNANDQVTQSGAIIGTPRYMSPEALQGKFVDGRSDLYSLGVVFYEMLMKEPPYEAEDYMAIGLKHITDPIPVLPRRFERFQEFLEKVMAKKPEDRYQSGLELIKAVQALRVSPATQIPVLNNIAQDDRQVGDFASATENSQPSHIKVVKNIPVKNIPQQSKNRSLASAPAVSLKQSTEFGETCQSKMGFLKRYTFICNLVVMDAASFSMIFSSLTTKLLDWRNERAGTCEAIAIQLTCNTAVMEIAKKRLNALYASDEPYAFIRKLRVTLLIKNIDDDSEDLYSPDV